MGNSSAADGGGGAGAGGGAAVRRCDRRCGCGNGLGEAVREAGAESTRWCGGVGRLREAVKAGWESHVRRVGAGI